MNQPEQFLKSNILQKRSPKGIRGFRWQKRMFRLYHDRIVYCSIQTDIPLGEIPLVCITKIIEYPDKKKNRFNICMGNFRTFELQSTTPTIANEWIQILKSSIIKFSKEEQNKMLQKQNNRFWKIDTVLTNSEINSTFQPVTKPQQPPFKQYNQQQKQPFRHNNINENMDDETNSDPGRYDGYQNNILKEDTITPIPTQTHTKLKESKHKKLKFGHHSKDKKHKKHKRPQSNKFFGTNSKKNYLKNRNKNKQLTKNNKNFNKNDTTINNTNDVITKTQSFMNKDYNNRKMPKPHHSLERSSSANELPDTINNNNKNKHQKHQKHKRLSIMDTPLPQNIQEYKVEEEFYTPDIESSVREPTPPFGKVAIVSCIGGNRNDKPYLLQVCPKSSIAETVMNRMGNLINPYIITQLQRGHSTNNTIEWSTYNCPSNGCLTNCLHLFRNVSVTSVRILIAEVICGLEYLHSQNFNFPNLSPETIYISHKSHIILTDFGFALPNTPNQPIYRSGPLCYAPPEFLSNGQDDIKSDWWRLGILIYHLIIGKPPFMGSREYVCDQICNAIINEQTLFGNINDFEIDKNAKDLILKLIKRNRKDRLGCTKPIKNKKWHKGKKQYYGVEAIMNHPFFECIYSKKNKEYHFTWNNIRKREHKPAPILRHLATRPTDSPRDKLNNPKTWKDIDTKMDMDDDVTEMKTQQIENREVDREGSIIDTTDDEEEFQTDEEDEKSQQQSYQSLSKSGNNSPLPGGVDDYIQPNSFSNSYNNLAGSGPSSYNNSLNNSGSNTSNSNNELNQSNNKPFSYPKPQSTNNQSGLSPLPQSKEPHHKIFKKHPPSPIVTDNSNSGSNVNTPTRPITPIQSQFNIKPKGARHRKNLSSMHKIPTKALPPPPPNNKQLPQLTQSQVSTTGPDSFGNNGLNILNEHESNQNDDSRFAQYVQHQQEQMGMIMNDDLNTPINNNNYNKNVGINNQSPQPQYGVPRFSNLPDQDEKKPVNDASTIVSDQIAAAAMLRQPILTEKQREKQKKKDIKKFKKKSKKKHKNFDEIQQAQIEKEKKYRNVQINVPTTPIRAKTKSKGLGSVITKKVRSKVSKKKRRFIDKVNGFNLDLTYITKRIIAMGFPSEGREEMYRNPTKEVKRFFNTYHTRRFRVYNLCIEKDRQYPDSKFTDIGGSVARFQFKDHNSPDLELVLAFCKDLHQWLGRDKKNIAAIHCKAGKGRTGVMICAYLAYAKICKDSQDALAKYGLARTKNAKGVTIPSQRRWVLYFIDYVMNPQFCPNPNRFPFYKICILKRVRMITIPDFDMGGGCDPYFLIKNTKGHVLYDYSQHNPVKNQQSKTKRKKKKNKPGSGSIANEDISNLDIVKFRHLDIILRGAFKIVFYDKDVLSSDDIMCWCWFHSAIAAKEKKIVLDRENIDGAVKDKAYKHFSQHFGLEFEFDTPIDPEKEKDIETEPNLQNWMDTSNNASFRSNKPKQKSKPVPPPSMNSNNNNNNMQSQKRHSTMMNNRPNNANNNNNNNNIQSQKRHSTMINNGPNVNNNNVNNNNNNNMSGMGSGNYSIKPKGSGQNKLGLGNIATQKRHSTMSSGVDTRNTFKMNNNKQQIKNISKQKRHSTMNNNKQSNNRHNSNPNVPAFGGNDNTQNQNQQFNNQYGGRNNGNNNQFGNNNNNQYVNNRGQNQNQNQNQQYNQNNYSNNNQRPQQNQNNQNNQYNNQNNRQNNQYNDNNNQYNNQNQYSNNNYGQNVQNNVNRNQYNPNQNQNNQYNQNRNNNQYNQNQYNQNQYNNQNNNQYNNNNNNNNIQSNVNQNQYNPNPNPNQNNNQYNRNQYNNNNNNNNNQYNNNQSNQYNNPNNNSNEPPPQSSGQYSVNNNQYYANNRQKNLNNFSGQHKQNHHYGSNGVNNDKPIQPPSIAVNTQMMNTIRQNMQHHLDNNKDKNNIEPESPGTRKKTLV